MSRSLPSLTEQQIFTNVCEGTERFEIFCISSNVEGFQSVDTVDLCLPTCILNYVVYFCKHLKLQNRTLAKKSWHKRYISTKLILKAYCLIDILYFSSIIFITFVVCRSMILRRYLLFTTTQTSPSLRTRRSVCYREYSRCSRAHLQVRDGHVRR